MNHYRFRAYVLLPNPRQVNHANGCLPCSFSCVCDLIVAAYNAADPPSSLQL
jgi:hypothetical protein